MSLGTIKLKRSLMMGAVVAGALMLAPSAGMARDNDDQSSAVNGNTPTTMTDTDSQKKPDADDVRHNSTSVTGHRVARSSSDSDDKMGADRDDKARADADDAKKGTDTFKRSARNGDHDSDDSAGSTRSNRYNANSNGRFAADRDRGLARAEDRHERHFFERVSFHRHHHHHIVLRDRDRDRDEMRGDRDRDDSAMHRDRDRDEVKVPH